MLVLSVSMIVTVIGLSALMATRIQRRTFEGSTDAGIARRYAQSAIDLALLKIKQDPNWRQTYFHNTWVTDQSIGSGTFKWKLVDTIDTDLSNDNTHFARLIAWGMEGNATQKESVLLEPFGQGLTALEVAMHANVEVQLSTSIVVQCNQVISSNNMISVGESSILNADVEAMNNISNSGAINGVQTTGITPRGMPGSTVFEYYIANGTLIPASSLPVSFGSLLIQNNVISPALNPYGTGQTNAQGIYVIDCLGQDIQITNCRIVGTLVLLNTGLRSEIRNQVNWKPAVANYPVLLVQGNIKLGFASSGSLGEGTPVNTNFNPIGTPYNGNEDTDTLDNYPSIINGLVYVSNDAFITMADPAFNGVLIVGNAMECSSNLNLIYDPSYLNNPPPGFTDGSEIRVSPGSWNKEVD